MPDAETLIGLVRQYSPSGHEQPAVTWLVERMRDLGFGQAWQDQAGNAVGVMGDGERQIVLLGHIDTVPGEISVQVEDGVLFGRGSVDAKGPLASFVDTVAALGPQPGWRLVVVGAVEEERNSEGARFAVDQYHPEFAIIGEPNQWERVALGYKGSAWAELYFERSMAHTASREEPVCETAFQAWWSVQEYARAFNAGKERAFDQLMPSLRKIESGDDGFTTWARLTIGARLPIEMPPETWYTSLKDLVPGARFTPAGFAVPAWQSEKNTPLIRALLSGIREAGGKPAFVNKTGTADLNIVAPAWKCPTAVYGPGDSALDHTPNEHISLDEYFKAVSVLRGALAILTR